MRVQIVSFSCVLKNNLGQVISSSFNSDVVTTPAPEQEANVLPGFVEALKDVKKGEKKRIALSAEKAYGFYDPALLITLPRSFLANGKRLRMEDQVKGSLIADGLVRTYRVVGENSRSVTLDGNHPLAGQDLVFDIEITASREEVEQDFDFVPSKKDLLC